MSEKSEKKRKRKETEEIFSSNNIIGDIVTHLSIPITSKILESSNVLKKSPTLAVGSFGTVRVSKDLRLDVFQEQKPESRTENFLIHGEDSVMEYEGTASISQPQILNKKLSHRKSHSATSDGTEETKSSNYLVALYDSSLNSIELCRAPFFYLNPLVRSKRQYKGKAIKSANSETTNADLRTTLGHTFGTRKAQKLLRSRELNQIDSSALSDIREDIVDSVSTSTHSLPSLEEIKETKEKERIIPPFFENAKHPSEIYPIENIIPPKEWKTIRVDAILNEPDIESRSNMLPYPSNYIKSRLIRSNSFDASNPSDANFVKLIYYLSFLLGFYHNRRTKKKQLLVDRLHSPPDLIVNGALERFSNSYNPKSRDGRFILDQGSELKLFAYISALALRVDSYILEVLPLANELNIKPSKLTEILYAMGCNVKVATSAQAEELQLHRSVATNYKIATLSVPFKAPDTSVKRRAGQSRR